MIVFLLQSALLILVSIVVGYLIARWLRSTSYDKHVGELQTEQSALTAALERDKSALANCESQRLERLTAKSEVAAAPTIAAVSEVEPAAAKPTFLDAPDGTPDDLKKISGIGNKLEGTLNDLGIFHFWQIADFTREDVERIDDYLSFKGRIDREKWIEQAKGLATGDKPRFLNSPDGTPDDLKKISGVGKKLEKTLNDLGIFHFWQVAAFTPGEVERLDEYLRFKGRIGRENWIEQAKTLAAGDDTDFSNRYTDT